MTTTHDRARALAVVFLAVMMMRLGDAIPLCSGNTVNGPTPTTATCPVPGSSPTFALAQAAAVNFAPVIYFHPLEKYYPMSVERWLPSTAIYDTNRDPVANTTEATLLTLSSSPIGNTLYIASYNTSDAFRAGDPFDAQNRSTADIYYNVFQEPTRLTWVFNYYIFYAYDGCAQQSILETSRNEQTRLEYEACDVGVHEGDWESVRVEVCGDLATVLQIQMGQHAWDTRRDCTQGECNFHSSGSGTRPFVVSSLQKHASHDLQAYDVVYFQVTGISEVPSLDSAALVDRPVAGVRHFFPTVSNVIALDDPDGRVTTSYNVSYFQSRLSIPMKPDWDLPSWVTYSGRWGDSYIVQARSVSTPICLLNNQTVRGVCANNGLLQLAQATIGLGGPGLGALLGDLLNEETSFLSTPGPTGPRQKGFFYALVEPDDSLLGSERAVCPNATIFIGEPRPLRSVERASDGVVIAFFVVGLATAVTFLLCVLGFLARRNFYVDGPVKIRDFVLLQRHKRTCGKIRESIRTVQPLAISTVILTGGGAAMAYLSFSDVWELLRRDVNTEWWDRLENIALLWAPFVIFASVCALVSSFLTTGLFFDRICVKRTNKYECLCIEYGWAVQIAIIVALLGSFFVSLTFFSFATIVYFLTRVFGEACDASANELTGVCLNLDRFGYDKIFCGSDFRAVCNDWAAVDGSQALLGTLLVVLGQTMFLMQSAVQYRRFRSLWKLFHKDDENEDDDGQSVTKRLTHEYQSTRTGGGGGVEDGVALSSLE